MWAELHGGVLWPSVHLPSYSSGSKRGRALNTAARTLDWHFAPDGPPSPGSEQKRAPQGGKPGIPGPSECQRQEDGQLASGLISRALKDLEKRWQRKKFPVRRPGGPRGAWILPPGANGTRARTSARRFFYRDGLQLPTCSCVLSASAPLPSPPLPRPPPTEGRASRALWGSRGRDGTERDGFLGPEGGGWLGPGPGRTAEKLRPGAATRPSAHTKGRGPRTRLSLQALRTRPNPRATVETATPSTRYFLPGPSL